MSDFGMFESDEATQAEPRLAAKTAARKLEAAIDGVRKDFGRFLIAATGIDEFEDRWHLSKHDIRAAVEPLVFPNTGTMRRIKNALKADWKLAHPYKLGGGIDTDSLVPTSADASLRHRDDKQNNRYTLQRPGDGYGPNQRALVNHNSTEIMSGDGVHHWASRRQALSHDEAGFGSMPEGDGPPKNQHLEKTYHPSDENLIPEGDFHSWKDSVDQGGPEKVQANDFTPGGDSGSAKNAAKTEWKKVNNDGYPAGADGGNMTKAERDRYNAEQDEEHGLNREAAALVADIYTDFAQANGLRVASLDTLDHYAETGIAEADYRLLQSMIIRAAEEAEEKDSEGSEDDEDDDSDDDTEDSDFGGEESSEGDSEEADDEDDSEDEEEYDFGDENGDGEHDDEDHHTEDDDDDEEEYDFGGGDTGGGEEQDGGQQFTVPEQAPELEPQLLNEIPHDDTDGSAPVPPEVVDSLLGLPPGTIEQLLLEEVEQGQGGGDQFGGPPPQGGDDFGGAPEAGGDDFFGGGGGDNTEPPRIARRRQARQFWAAPDESESAMMGRQRQQQRDSMDTKFGPAPQAKPNIQELYKRAQSGDQEAYATLKGLYRERGWTAARRFWAADDEQQSEGGGDSGGEEQAPPQDPAAGGMDPNAMGGGMMPPPGSQAVAPPQPAQPLENQPAEDALLDTANQAIMQMIDRETQEYQQIIGPLSQALQAVQFAQQVEQAEHPMDVTPPEGTVNVDPSQAPGGAQNPQQQLAYLMRQAGGQGPEVSAPWADSWDHMTHETSVAPGTPPEEALALARELRRLKTQPQHLEHRPVDGMDDNRLSFEGRKVRTLKNAARLIAKTYGVSERMLVEAMSRRHYEHLAEAFHILPPQARQTPEVRAAANHIGKMLQADNQMFSFEHWMNSTVGPASGSRLPFDRPRLAGETWKNTPTMDRFEFANEQPEITDNMTINDLPQHQFKGLPKPRKNSSVRVGWGTSPKVAPKLPKMPSQKSGDDVMGKYERYTRQRAEDGLNFGDNDVTVENFLRDRKIGEEAAGKLHGELGISHPPIPQATMPKGAVPKAKNPVTKRGTRQVPLETLYLRHKVNGRHGVGYSLFPGPNGWDDHDALGVQVKWDEDPLTWGPEDNPDTEYAQHRTDKWPYNQVGYTHYDRQLYPISDFHIVGTLPGNIDPDKNQDVFDPRIIGASKEATWGEWEPPKTASFFTRRVPGWKWDDHLNGYISKEGKAFQCSCGQKIAAPSYKSCDCGKIWNVYAIGDQHHLGSNTADMFIAREIPVRDNVIMANKKMAGDVIPFPTAPREPEDDESYEEMMARHQSEDAYRNRAWDKWLRSHGVESNRKMAGEGMSYEDAMSHIDDVLAKGEKEEDYGDSSEYLPINSDEYLRQKYVTKAQRSNQELLAMIDKLADWTKYDSPDPINDMGKSKPPSTSVAKPPKDWATRLPKGDPSKRGGTWTPPTIPRKKK